ncbi:helix-turn-helix domain-containing protein [Methanomethylovorans sp.]|uniref:helix-turn-helix domain-containing protein n=1 Tax=Methanomethylovorans sp. TaxID=2758717 RepID=UPI002FDE0550
MESSDRIMNAIIDSYDEFQRTFSIILKEDIGMTAVEFAQEASIPASTLYKIMSGKREPNMKTLRQIIKTIKRLQNAEKGDFIAVIAARPVLDNIRETKKKIGGNLCTIREYSATSIEEAIIAAVKAEREGACALVCAPIISSTVEKILRIPVATIMPRNSLMEAIERVSKKIS